MKTTYGRDIKRLRLRVTDDGWSWDVADGEDYEMLDPDHIAKLNDALGQDGVVIAEYNRKFPIAQVLCG